ncbi:MAG TPA: DnaA N-terminal domain-containing protein, partial [Roseiflexaceae bacterium]|nr:DnaA N-terminal domain-containing protein [Roseiflexaceae bacterium]
AIAHAESRPGVRDVAAWTVSLLHANRAYGWQIPAASGPAHAPTAPEDRAGYAARVRAQLAGGGLLPGLVAEPAPASRAATAVAAVPDELPATPMPDASQARLDRLWSRVCGDLQAELGRAAYQTWLRGTVLVSVAHGVASVLARDDRQREHLERAYARLLAERLGIALGQAVRVVVVVRAEAAAQPSDASPPPSVPAPAPRAGAPPDEHARPDWISPGAWDVLPSPLQAALSGAQLQNGRIVPRQRLHLRTLGDPRYATLLARLLAAASPARSA